MNWERATAAELKKYKGFDGMSEHVWSKKYGRNESSILMRMKWKRIKIIHKNWNKTFSEI